MFAKNGNFFLSFEKTKKAKNGIHSCNEKFCYFRDAEAPNEDIAKSLFIDDDVTANLENLSNVFNEMNRKFACINTSKPKV